jgi:hypothetical protein
MYNIQYGNRDIQWWSLMTQFLKHGLFSDFKIYARVGNVRMGVVKGTYYYCTVDPIILPV